MEDHQLNSFINPRMQFGDLKYKTSVESLLFDSENQKLMRNVYEIFQKHISLFKTLKQNNLQENHINALISKQIIGNGIIEKKLASNIFSIGFQKIFGQNQYDLAQAVIQFKNYMTNTLKLSNIKDSPIEELLKLRDIHIQLDLEETKLFMIMQNQDKQFDFIKNYILYNIQKTENFIEQLKFWKIKYENKNDEQLRFNVTIQVHFNDWIEQVKQIIEKLWMPYCSQQDELYLAQPKNDQPTFKPLQYISDIYEKKKGNFFIIDSLISHINNHQYNFDRINIAFGYKTPKEVLIAFVELLDWCNDIQKWEKMISQLVQNIKMEYQTTQLSYQESFGDGGFVMQNQLDAILNNIVTKYEEKGDTQKQTNFINVESLDESNFEGILYEIKQNGIDYYDDKLMVCGSFSIKFQEQSRIDGKIGQIVMDIPGIKKINIQVNQITSDFIQPLWQSDNLKSKVIKISLYKIAQCIKIEIETQNKKSTETLHKNIIETQNNNKLENTISLTF